MSETRVFGEAKRIGEKILHPLSKSVCYDVPSDATHILIRPVRKGVGNEIFVIFARAGLPIDYKPQNNSGKYFYRLDGAKRCRVEVYLRPGGWIYNVEWLQE